MKRKNKKIIFSVLGIVIGYAWMLWLAQLPDDERVLVRR